MNRVSDILRSIGGTAKDLRSAITGDLPPELRVQLESQVIQLEMQVQKNLADIAMIEARKGFWYSGYRPALGWSCTVAFILESVVFRLLRGIFPAFSPPEFDMELMMPLLFAILGIGAMRTVEKIRGVQDKH